MPQTCQPGRPLRQIACRRARRRLDRRGAAEEQRVAGHGPAVVVEDDGQPRLPGPPLPVFQQDVEFRMIGLPDGVGTGRLVAMDQVEGVGVGLRPLVGQGRQGRVQRANRGRDGIVGRWDLAEPIGEGEGPAVDGRHGQRRLAQGQALDGLAQRVGEMPLAPIAPPLAGQPGEPLAAILPGPAGGGPQGEAPLPGHTSQRDPLLQMRAEEFKTLERQGTLGLGETAKRWLRHDRR